MSCPIFCLKTADDTEPTLDLVNANGVGNAIPTRSGFSDLDHRFNYSSGDVGKVPVRLQHDLTLSMDEVIPAVRQKLIDWKFKRTPVTLCPLKNSWPVTDDTELLILPSNQDSGTFFLDETGRYSLYGAFSDKKYIWREDTKELVERASGEMITERTLYGQGWRFHGDAVNLGSPSSPESITSGYGTGNAGWVFSLDVAVAVALGSTFPAAAPYEEELHFSSSTGGASALYILQAQLAPPVNDDGYFHFSVWLKGSMGQKARLDCVVESVLDNSLDLSGMVFDDWTRITVEAYRADWTGLDPQIELHFNGATEDTVDFRVGPHMATYLQTSASGVEPHWCFDNTAISPAYGYAASVDNAGSSTEGTMTLDFVIPDTAALGEREAFSIGLGDFGGGGGAGRIYLFKAVGSAPYLYVGNSPSTQVFALPAKAYAAGRHVYSIAYDSAANTLTLVVDGKLVEARSVTVDAYAGGVRFYFGPSYPRGNPLFYFLAMRLDRVAMSPLEIGNHQLTLLNDVARGTYELTQGRYYEIVSVPQTPLIQEGNAIWLGDLVLRQVEYTPGGAVWYADEGDA